MSAGYYRGFAVAFACVGAIVGRVTDGAAIALVFALLAISASEKQR